MICEPKCGNAWTPYAPPAPTDPPRNAANETFATMYENRLTQLRSVEDRLVFGRLDAKNGDRHYIGPHRPVEPGP